MGTTMSMQATATNANVAETSLRRTLAVATRYTIMTTILLGLGYPLLVTGLAQMLMPHKANGQLIVRDGQVIGSAIIAQGFTSDRYFHVRPSAAGNGYDAASSGGSNLAPSNRALMTRIDTAVSDWRKKIPGQPVPIGLVTESGSGLDPDISPGDASYQVPAVAVARHLPQSILRALVQAHTQPRQLGFLGEPRVDVLQLNLSLDALDARQPRTADTVDP